jgi:predicted Rossmann fold flavoprotein
MSSGTPVVVVGAGAGGILAAWRAASLGASVVLLEKTPRIGTKILISGGGKCNITHDGPLEDLIRAFRPPEARFIRPSCYRFTNQQVVDMLTSRGLNVYTRPDGRIFPVDQNAKDVVAILGTYLVEAGVDVRLNTPVTDLLVEDGAVVGVKTASGSITVGRVIVAVGGASYPNSGTTGDGWRWAKSIGHRVVKPRAALAPIELELAGGTEWAGVALRDVGLKVRGIVEGKIRELARWQGDLLFTHRGISGPCALGVSREAAEALDKGSVEVEIDLVPQSREESLSEDLLAVAQMHPRRLTPSLLPDSLPDRLRTAVLEEAQVDPTIALNKLDRKSRNRLAGTLKRWRLGIVTRVPLEKGEVTAGGIDLDEVDPQTMASRVVRGLYLCGEVLDIAGPVGGYNLQAAFATGFVAGESTARMC